MEAASDEKLDPISQPHSISSEAATAMSTAQSSQSMALHSSHSDTAMELFGDEQSAQMSQLHSLSNEAALDMPTAQTGHPDSHTAVERSHIPQHHPISDGQSLSPEMSKDFHSKFDR